MPDTLVDFMRHGMPVGGRRYRGHGVDDALSEEGWRQMWSAAGQDASWQHIVSSPLSRCADFAREFAGRNDLPLTIDARFREVGFGSWEGLSPGEIEQADPQAFAAFYQDPVRNRPPGAEPLETFGARVAEAMDDVVRLAAGKHLLVVAHAGVVRAALGYVLGAEPVAWYRVRVDNASLTRFRHDVHGFRLEYQNCLSPLRR